MNENDLAVQLAELIGALSGIFAGALQGVLEAEANRGQMTTEYAEDLFNQVRDNYLRAIEQVETKVNAFYDHSNSPEQIEMDFGKKHYGMPAEMAVFSS